MTAENERDNSEADFYEAPAIESRVTVDDPLIGVTVISSP